jgi:hypothetical protein
VTIEEALSAAYDRAAGVCECIGGGCPSRTHRPGVNRCSAPLRTFASTCFFAAARFADRTDPENIYAVCRNCADSPRRQGQRIPLATADEGDSAPTDEFS